MWTGDPASEHAPRPGNGNGGPENADPDTENADAEFEKVRDSMSGSSGSSGWDDPAGLSPDEDGD